MKNVAMPLHFPYLSLSDNSRKMIHHNSSFFTFNELGFYKFHGQSLVLQHHSSSSHFSHIVCVSSSSAEFPGQSLDEVTKRMKVKKSKRIAGIEQDELVDDPALLADPDSRFCEFRGVKMHHKVFDSELLKNDGDLTLTSSKSSQVVSGEARTERVVGLPMILLHGFGASLFSWNRVMKRLAEICGSKVVAFDRPAFGLTSRSNFRPRLGNGDDATKLNPYSMAFSVLATLHFIGILGAEKAILVGHSAGSFVAVNSYFEAPERVAALILVAPAILAPFTVQREVNKRKSGDSQIQEDSLISNSSWGRFFQLFSVLVKFAKFLWMAITQLTKGIVGIVNSLYRKLLKAFLQSALAISLIRVIIDKFGIFAVKKSWYDSNLCTEQVLAGYTKPLRVKGWDGALVEYVASLITETAIESKPPLGQRLSEISCPVLIVTGDSDRIVPAWNAERLAWAIPGCCFEVIKQCGHLPQEEKVDEFVSVVQRFLHTTFVDPQTKPEACT